MNQASKSPDAEELFHSGLQASEEGQHYEAIVQLELSLAKKPHVRTYYLLAVEYAEIGMYENATKGMQAAIQLDPKFWIAYYQLGLLYLMQDQVEVAIQTWGVLQQLDKSDPFYLFGVGMIHLANNNFNKAIEYLKKGISNNTINPYLNDEILSILSKIQMAENEIISDNSSNELTWRYLFLSAE